MLHNSFTRLLAGGALAIAALGSTVAHAAPVGGDFTSVTGSFTPGGELLVVFPCGDPDFGHGAVQLYDDGILIAQASQQGEPIADEFSITITIPADVPDGTQLTLQGQCTNTQSESVVNYGALGFTVGSGPAVPTTTLPSTSVGAGSGGLPATGSTTLPMAAVAAGLVAVGVTLRAARRTAPRTR